MPSYWKLFVDSHCLIDSYIEIPEESNLSKLGCSLQIYSESKAADEADNFYPGIAAKKHGFVPVACCLIASGDPYFINSNDGEFGSLYRIYHDGEMIDDENFNLDDAVVVVLKDYRDILNFTKK
ncbi:hypothetical protein Q4561_13845 [Alteromonas sp. 1_MG-2023]|uniref:hypothetical protein n=1 Tax=Alteromonas sp. 1_MG-2023 TaxID=3062669 RepID=UPI0026E48E35|nr:hypothetical protein [Alteromonas sp. 1_MG-2023]MDO6568150.1 hypothetical protein [Alteromonas sp. 1_MG-2023]